MQTNMQLFTNINYLCMSLNKSELLEMIINTCNEKEINSSLIHKHTNLSEPGIRKILDRKTKNPRQETLRIIWDFVRDYEIIGPNSPIFLQEPPNHYGKSIEDKIADKVIEKLRPFLKNLSENN